MHPRLTPANGRVAHSALKGKVTAERFHDGQLRQIAKPVVDLLREPGGTLDSQLLLGAGFLVLEDLEGISFGQSQTDGYVGYVRSDELADFQAATHRLTALASHTYPRADLKSGALSTLSFGAQVTVSRQDGDFFELSDGTFVPTPHLATVDQLAPDFIATFERFLGIPYLWGGNSVWGMDCSAAVQLALHAAGPHCSRDTDMQEVDLGQPLPENAALQRGDLVFWDGHVGMMRDSVTLIHANAHHMAVASETLEGAIARIIANGGGPVSSYRRL